MPRLVQIFLLVTVAVLLFQTVSTLVSGGSGLGEQLAGLGVGVLLLALTTQLQLKRPDKDGSDNEVR